MAAPAKTITQERRAHQHCADLVLAGGGVKGIAHVGAIRALQAFGYTEHPRVAGTSVGAIVGALVAIGTPVDEIERLILEFPFAELADESLLTRLPGGRLVSLRFEQGVYEGDVLGEWLASVLGPLTFGDLRAQRGLSPEDPPPLVILATDVTRGRLVQFPDDYVDYGLVPDEQLVTDAIRASTAIPLYFEPFELGESKLVDGGVLANFAVDVLDRTDAAGEPLPPRWPTFGVSLLMFDDAQSVGANLMDSVVRIPGWQLLFGELATYLNSLLGTLVVGQDAHVARRWWMANRTIALDTSAAQVVDFEIEAARKRELLESGAASTDAFLETWTGDDGRAVFPLPEGA